MPIGAAKFAYQGYSVVTVPEGITRPQTITAVNDTQIDTAISKFGGASMLMDGTGDYAYITGGDGTGDFSGDFTIEFWIYYNSLQNANILDWRGIHSTHTGGGTGTFALASTLLLANNSGDFKCWIDGADRSTSGVIFSTGTWYHIAVQRSSGTVNAWVNGTRYVDYSGSTVDYSSVLAANQPIGANSSTSSQVSYLNGNIDELRISTVARYTNGASITVPTAAFVNDSDTYLLMHANGTDGSTALLDDAGVRASVGVSAINDAQIDTAQSKFGGASALFDGTGDYLTAAMPDQGTGDWTVECWVYATSWSGQNHNVYADPGNAQGFIDSSGRIAYFRGSTTAGTTVLSTNTWHHVSWTRSNGIVYMHINGTYETSRGDATNHNGDRYIGVNINGNGAYWDGHIDEWRFSDGNRYGVTTGNFTAPTAAFENDADTVLLLHMDGADASTTFTDDNG